MVFPSKKKKKKKKKKIAELSNKKMEYIKNAKIFHADLFFQSPSICARQADIRLLSGNPSARAFFIVIQAPVVVQ